MGVWGYSANDGQTEQGRIELRSGGAVRTTWGWGTWALLPSAPHCPPPRRACPLPSADANSGTASSSRAETSTESGEKAAQHEVASDKIDPVIEYVCSTPRS